MRRGIGAFAVSLIVAGASHAQNVPNLPTRNPWLADSVYPISHDNPAATEAVSHAGPTKGRRLSVADAKTVPNVFTSNPTVKNVDGETIIIAAGVDGIRKILATGKNFELVSFLPYPGLEGAGSEGHARGPSDSARGDSTPRASQGRCSCSRCPRRWRTSASAAQRSPTVRTT